MGCCHSTYSELPHHTTSQDPLTSHNNTNGQEIIASNSTHISHDKRTIELLFNFDNWNFNESPSYRQFNNKIDKLKKITENHSYDFVIDDYSRASALLFIFDHYNKNNLNQSFHYTYGLTQVITHTNTNTYVYLFVVNIELIECIYVEILRSLIILIDLIPHEYFIKKYPNFNGLTITEDLLKLSKRYNPSVGNISQDFLSYKNVLSYNGSNSKYGTFGYNSNECVICMERIKNILFVPCHHFAVCRVCANLHSCPICRTQITDRISVIHV